MLPLVVLPFMALVSTKKPIKPAFYELCVAEMGVEPMTSGL